MKKRPIYYDTETTGIDPKTSRIIEIAAFDPENNATFDQLINPQIPIPKEASAVHNIVDEMVKDAPTFKEVGPLFADFCKGNVVLIAHNNDAFDKPFLEAEFRRNEIVLPKFETIDSLLFSRKYRPDLPRHSLQALREYYGFPANTAHRALDDVKILHQVFLAMIDDLSMENILDLMQQKTTLKQMPFGKHKGTPIEKIPPGYVKWLETNGALDKPENQALKEAFAVCGLC